MSQRQCAKTQGLSLKVAWQGIAWKKVQRHVFRLQKRMYRAAQREDVRTVHKLPQLLVHDGMLDCERCVVSPRTTGGNTPRGSMGPKPLHRPNDGDWPTRFLLTAPPPR